MRRGWLPALALALSLSGCALLPRPVNIAQLRLMRTMALDTGAEGVRLTLFGDLQKESAGGETRSPLILTGEGATLAAAAAQADEAGEGRLEYGHLEECVFGEALARRGLGSLTDYLERDASIRSGTKLFLLRGEAGKALSAQCDDHTAPTRILTDLTGEGEPVLLRTLLADQADNGLALLPALDRDLRPAGMAWLEGQRLGGWLDREESLGAALLTGENRQETFQLELPQGPAAVRLSQSSCRWRGIYDARGNLTGAEAWVTVKARVTQLPESLEPEQCQGALERELEGQVEGVCRAALGACGDRDLLHLRRRLLSTQIGRGEAVRQGFAHLSRLDLRVEVRGEITE